jgi:predicted RNA-binding Zn ribbon-like protein
MSATIRPIAEIRLDGGRPCLDFVNTIHDRYAAEPEDYIATPERYVSWSLHAGLLSPSEAQLISRQPPGAALMRDARELRELLHQLFCRRIERKRVGEASVQALDAWLHLAWRDLRLDLSEADCVAWPPGAVDAQLPLKRVALSALRVLRDDSVGRLKRCSARGECGWLFYDETKNGGRRWCSMETCGASVKMRRYRQG